MKTSRTIETGDKVYARLYTQGRTIVEVMVDNVSCLTELLMDLRVYASREHGLVNMYVRNLSRGWSMQRPLMLYSRKPQPAVGSGAATRPHITFPWEVH